MVAGNALYVLSGLFLVVAVVDLQLHAIAGRASKKHWSWFVAIGHNTAISCALVGTLITEVLVVEVCTLIDVKNSVASRTREITVRVTVFTERYLIIVDR